MLVINRWFPDLVRRAEDLREAMQRYRDTARDKNPGGELEKICLQEIGLPFSIVRKSSPESLYDLVGQSSNADERGLLLAELLIEEGELNEAAGDFPGTIRARLQAVYLIGKSFERIPPENQPLFRSLMDELVVRLRSAVAAPYLTETLRAIGY